MSKTTIDWQRVDDIIHAFPDALASGAITFNYQPIVNSVDESCSGTEILVRWNDAKLGFVPPDEFVPLLESAGLIGSLGSASLSQGMKTFQEWQKKGIAPHYMSVNISPAELEDPAFAARVLDNIKVHHFDVHHLQLEITEGLQFHDVQTAHSNVVSLSRAGVHIALDDFGSGYSGFTRLLELPVDVIKISRTTTQRHLSDTKGKGGLAAIAAFAKKKGLAVVAEGVEDAQDVARLARIGITNIQGYVYSRPLEAAAIEPFLRDHLVKQVRTATL